MPRSLLEQRTGTGEIHEEPGRTGRAEDGQLQPGICPLIRGEAGGILAAPVVRRVWRRARKAVLLPHVLDSPAGAGVRVRRKAAA
ncbi:hypothetical protein P1P68_09380 [Streptomyces scabiei]|uniref:hypothetical protein n=1 Tax=Streptomyces scabiei TaxID=1930 RepID=UPI00298F7C28|nr:hypothetical protein [Streptomyces scabiei]MDW8804993.1 hypothetical protein [Streptomyces scabiei]